MVPHLLYAACVIEHLFSISARCLPSPVGVGMPSLARWGVPPFAGNPTVSDRTSRSLAVQEAGRACRPNPSPCIFELRQRTPESSCRGAWQATISASPFGLTDSERRPCLPPYGERSRGEPLRPPALAGQ